MRLPIFKITNDDDPMDCETPCAVTLDAFAGEYDVYADVQPLLVGQSVTVGGGAAVQFTLTRIR